MTKKDCKPHFDLQVKEREISEAIVRAMVKQTNSSQAPGNESS